MIDLSISSIKQVEMVQSPNNTITCVNYGVQIMLLNFCKEIYSKARRLPCQRTLCKNACQNL